jgi:TetR/AcrR family acrAB operon transcriptional repressor
MTAPVERKRRIDEIGDESRRRILDAAEALFAERGFERTSFASIARRSGISRGSIPWHFANKDGLLIAVVERALARQVVESRSIEQGDLGVVMDDIRRWMHQPTAAMLYTLLAEALSTEGEVRDRFVGFHRRGRARLAALIEAAGADSSGAPPEVFATVVNGALLGLHLQWTLDPTVDLDAGLGLLARLIDRKSVSTGARRKKRTLAGRRSTAR